jgi:hypothetical protein
MFRPTDRCIPVRISVTFTWDIPEGNRLWRAWSSFYDDVQIGGPAFGDPGGEFTIGKFIKEGATFTSRGCIRSCPHCFVPEREGRRMREYPIKQGHIIQDNNLLACTDQHIKAVFDMLRSQRKAAIFSGGLDIRLLEPWHRELIDSIRVDELWFACDSAAMLKPLERAASILDGIPQRKRRCYVMIGYGDETVIQAQKRVEAVYAMGFDPFSQLYRGEGEKEYMQDWKDLNRKWSRPAAYKAASAPSQGHGGNCPDIRWCR